MNKSLLSWGRAHRFSQDVLYIKSDPETHITQIANTSPNGKVIPFGRGRSYGDVALNDQGVVIKTNTLDKVLDFDREKGIFRGQSGLTFDDILRFIVPSGWFLPVTPGTKFVTLGGAVANDVHGKNHHKAGSFGTHIKRIALIKPNGKTLICSHKDNTDLFRMTIGGLGLTGLILWVEFQLSPIKSAYLDVENIPYDNLEDFLRLSRVSSDWAYNVAWVDCFSPTSKLGRGIFTRAKFTEYGSLTPHQKSGNLTWPFPTPAFFLNRLSIKAFNRLYRLRPGARYIGRQHYNAFFYPLDGIGNWNKLYGRKGFYQHQSLVPIKHAKDAMTLMLQKIKKSGQGSFLAVMKLHGKEKSPGIMSFCQLGEGVSLALDFPNRGPKTLSLLKELDAIVEKYNGRLYPAKDGHMSATFFQKSYPSWKKLEANRDPRFQSSFWKRVTQITDQHSLHEGQEIYA